MSNKFNPFSGKLDLVGAPTNNPVFTGSVQLTGNTAIGTASGNAYLFHNDVNGLVLQGAGSTNDMLFVNSVGSSVFRIVTGTTTLRFYGTLEPSTSDAATLGSTSRMWSDLFLASGGVINFNAGDVTITHSANALSFAGATAGYTFDTSIRSIYAVVATSADVTLSTLTQGLTIPGNLVTSAYVDGGYTGGLMWSSTTDNPGVPKAGIFSKATGAGTYVYIGTSNSYASGITTTISIGPNGEMVGGNLTGINGTFSGSVFSAGAVTIGGQSTATAVSLEIGNYSGGTPFIDFKSSNVDYNMRILNSATDTLYFSSSTGTGTVGFTTRIVLDGNQSFTAASANAYLYHDNVNGLVIYGSGTTHDVICGAGNGSTVWVIPTNTSTLQTIGLLLTAASTTATSGLRIPHGAAPTSPVDGDMWTTTAGAFIRINGVTKTFTLI